MENNITRRTPAKLHAKVLYHFNGRTVRMVNAGPVLSAIRHHGEHMTVATHEILTATKDECKEYVKKP